MPLDLTSLKTMLAGLAEAPGSTCEIQAAKWADAMEAYATAIVPASPAVTAACDALEVALATAFATPAAAPGMELAFAAFAATVAGGMPPTATPPAGPVGFASQFAGPKPSTHADAGDQIGTLIDTWMRTGTAAGGAPWA